MRISVFMDDIYRRDGASHDSRRATKMSADIKRKMQLKVAWGILRYSYVMASRSTCPAIELVLYRFEQNHSSR